VYTVIIVDDDKWAIEDIKQSFRFSDWGFQIVGECYNAETALASILQQAPDLVISDIKMSAMSGLDMISACRQKGIESKFVLVSGYDSFDYVQEAFKNNVYYYLLKPLEDSKVDELMRRIQSQLDNDCSAKSLKPASSMKRDSISIAIDYINEHFTEAITLEKVAEKAYISKAYLSQMISLKLGVTFTYYKNSLRIRYAKQLIQEHRFTSMTEIAEQAGFDSSSQFSKVFRQHAHMSPQEYKRLIQK